MNINGLNRTTIKGYYDAHGGLTGYLGTTILDIPNLYMLAGMSSLFAGIAHHIRRRRFPTQARRPPIV